MGKSRRQLKADKARAENRLKAEREEKFLEENAQRLRTLTGGFSRSDREGSKSKLLFPSPYRRETALIPSAKSIVTIKQESKKLSPDMQKREEAAQQEIAKKKSRVAVLYNKGGLQYISDEMDPKTFGRK